MLDFKVYDISVIPLIIFVTKILTDIGIPKKFSPLITLLLSVLVGILYFSPQNILKGIMIGVFLSASSVGFYSGTKGVYEQYKKVKVKKSKDSI